jgi:hypothetical protein
MMELLDISVREGEVVVLASDVKLVVSKVNGSRPSAMTVKTDSSRIEIDNFAGGRFNTDVNSLIPTVEVLIWWKHVFIVGLPAIVIVSEGELLKCQLFRNVDEDTGFYRTEWLEVGQRLICVYESGILAWNEGGQQLWHISKFWDDVFAGFEGERLVLMIEGGDRIVIDPSNGSQERHPASWREAPHPRG